jgi:hypothetical protein
LVSREAELATYRAVAQADPSQTLFRKISNQLSRCENCWVVLDLMNGKVEFSMSEEESGKGSKQGNDHELVCVTQRNQSFWFVVGPRIHAGVGDPIQI